MPLCLGRCFATSCALRGFYASSYKPCRVENLEKLTLHCFATSARAMSSTTTVTKTDSWLESSAKACSRSGKPVFQISASTCLAASQPRQHAANLGASIMLQGFGWDSCHQHPHGSCWYDYVMSKVPELQVNGSRIRNNMWQRVLTA